MQGSWRVLEAKFHALSPYGCGTGQSTGSCLESKTDGTEKRAAACQSTLCRNLHNAANLGLVLGEKMALTFRCMELLSHPEESFPDTLIHGMVGSESFLMSLSEI